MNSTDLAHLLDIIFTKKVLMFYQLIKKPGFISMTTLRFALLFRYTGKAIVDEVDKVLSDDGIKCWHKEGLKALSWVLLDYVDVVVHVFKKDSREFYNLEKLWGDAPSEKMKDPLEKAVAKAK